ncbi:Rieske (2Fe-2S) protein [Sulfitobacter sp. TSTF-M16]|uniref:Rieske (2Fe-2S) protein n=2 Tax=Sulfitobacter aestuariivivens TaxID=2766981 RepID=A0A927D8B5_9RHOB|nr:Rieske (2Fe-2S) protein [Sulfitobacter aestuariivivens]
MTYARNIATGYNSDPSKSKSLIADAYTDQGWFDEDLKHIIAKTWQWVCHVEKTREPGSYVTDEIAGQPIAVVRDKAGELRAFYNVCKHRAHELLSGAGNTTRIMCPYHAWVYKLDGQLAVTGHLSSNAPH